MNKQNKKSILKVIICICVLVCINIMSFALIMGNRGECAFGEGGEKGISIKSYIIEGAGYFLSSYSDMLLFLNRVEMSELNGIDYNEMRDLLNKAIEKMEKTKDTYYHLTQTAEFTVYNRAMIFHLLSFDYQGFQKERGFGNTIFKEVASYLRKGDVRGFFAILLAYTDDILRKLYIVKESVDVDKFPDLSTLWRINQGFSKTLLYGQIAAEIFSTFLSQNCK